MSPLELKPRVVGPGKVMEAQIDHNCLGTDYSRKVYVVKDETLDMKFPATMHVHNTEEIVYPIIVEGKAVQAYLEDDEIKYHEVDRNQWYRITPGTPHQIRVTGRAVFEVYAPTRSLISPDYELRELEVDAFPDVEARGVKKKS